MKKRLLIIAAAIVAYFVRDAWRNHQRQERLAEEMKKQMPGMYGMSERVIVNSEWTCTGSLGETTLHFQPKGKLAVDVDGTTKIGRYEVLEGYAVNIWFPDSDKMQRAMFRETTDELFGAGWSAKRVQ